MVAMIRTADGPKGVAAVGLVPFDPEAARPLVRAIVTRNRRMFDAFPDLSREDLVQEGIRLALELHPKFDPNRGAYSTFLTNRLPNRLIDLWRSRTSQLRREQVTAERRGCGVIDDHPNAEAGPDDLAADAPLAEWLGRVYRAIVALAASAGGNHEPPPPKRGRPRTFTPAQQMAITVLIRKRNLSTRGAVQLLAERDDLRRAIRLDRVPTQKWVVQNAKKVIPNSPLASICFD